MPLIPVRLPAVPNPLRLLQCVYEPFSTAARDLRDGIEYDPVNDEILTMGGEYLCVHLNINISSDRAGF
jgi:hypothetical protein